MTGNRQRYRHFRFPDPGLPGWSVTVGLWQNLNSHGVPTCPSPAQSSPTQYHRFHLRGYAISGPGCTHLLGKLVRRPSAAQGGSLGGRHLRPSAWGTFAARSSCTAACMGERTWAPGSRHRGMAAATGRESHPHQPMVQDPGLRSLVRLDDNPPMLYPAPVSELGVLLEVPDPRNSSMEIRVLRFLSA